MPGLQYKNLRPGCGCKRSCQPNSIHQECRCSFPSGSCKGEEYDRCLFSYYTRVPAGFPAGFKNSHPGINAKREIQGTAVLLRASPEPFLENAGGSFDGSVGSGDKAAEREKLSEMIPDLYHIAKKEEPAVGEFFLFYGLKLYFTTIFTILFGT